MGRHSTGIKEECTKCPVGIASGTLEGQPCRFVDETWRRDESIYQEGDAVRQAYYIKTGTVILRRRTGNNGSNGEGRVTAIRFPGSFIGLELLVGETYMDTAVAGSDTTLCSVPKTGLDEWLGPKTSPSRTALELTLQTQATELTRRRQLEGTAAQRAASWLVTETPRARSIALRRRELADLLGMRAETLSRVLARLANLGAIMVSRSHVEVTDLKALQDVASGEVVPQDG